MKTAAIGIRVHSGWGAVITVSGDASEVDVLDRRRIIIYDPEIAGSRQPYHFAAQLRLPEAELYIERCTKASENLALSAVTDLVRELSGRDHRVRGAAILLASGRPLPALPNILASHALIHTAEGDFFRQAFTKTCERLGLRVTGIRENDLDRQASAIFGSSFPDVKRKIAGLKRSLGSPWTEDQKRASLAAMLVLTSDQERAMA